MSQLHEHVWVDGWQKNEPSYRWSKERQWSDDVPQVGCAICGKPRDPEARQLAAPAWAPGWWGCRD